MVKDTWESLGYFHPVYLSFTILKKKSLVSSMYSFRGMIYLMGDELILPWYRVILVNHLLTMQVLIFLEHKVNYVVFLL